MTDSADEVGSAGGEEVEVGSGEEVGGGGGVEKLAEVGAACCEEGVEEERGGV